MMQQTYNYTGVQAQKKAEGWKSIKRGLILIGISVVLFSIIVTFVVLPNIRYDVGFLVAVIGGIWAVAMLLFGIAFVFVGLIEMYQELYAGVVIQVICIFISLLMLVVQKLCAMIALDPNGTVLIVTNFVIIVLFCCTIPGLVFIIQGIHDIQKNNSIS